MSNTILLDSNPQDMRIVDIFKVVDTMRILKEEFDQLMEGDNETPFEEMWFYFLNNTKNLEVF